MENNKFWLTIWKFIILATMVLGLGIVSCNVHTDYRISKAISDGSNPVEARIAFSYSATVAEIAVVGLSGKEKTP